MWPLHGDEQRDSALSKLRVVLVRNLRKALSRYVDADDPFPEDAGQDSLL